MGYDYDNEESDDTCVHCGAAIWFDVGFETRCPACGKNYQYTDAELEQHRLDSIVSGNKALESMKDNRAKLEFLHALKPGRTPEEIRMIDQVMDAVDEMFEADRVRKGLPPGHEELCSGHH